MIIKLCLKTCVGWVSFSKVSQRMKVKRNPPFMKVSNWRRVTLELTHLTNQAQKAKLLRKTNLATTRLFRPDYSGILPTLMALQAVTGRSIEATGMRPDTIDCTPAARQIQAVGGIGYLNIIILKA